MKPGKVILFGVDGGTWRVLAKAIEDGKTAHFAEAVDSGSSGTLLSTHPYRTIPAWTSCFTGVNPGKHGMVDNIIKIDGEFVVCGARHREVETIWQMLSRRGEDLIVLNDPVAYPPENIGIHVTGFLTPTRSNNFVYPADLKKTLDKVVDGYIPEPKPEARKHLHASPERAYEILSEHSLKVAQACKYLVENYSWTTVATIYTSTDRVQHYFFNRDDLLTRHYAEIDKYLGQMMNVASKEEADMLIISDHGFQLTRKVFHINNFLLQKGYLIIRGSKLTSKISLPKFMAKILGKLVQHQHPHKSMVDIANSLAFSLTGHTIYVHENDERLKQELRTSLTDYRYKGEPIIRDVLSIEEVMWGPYTGRAGQLYLVPYEGVDVKSAITENEHVLDLSMLNKPFVGGIGFHELEGIMIFYGPRARRGVKLSDRRIWDIAPTILALRGFPIPDYFDGTPLIDAFPTISATKTTTTRVTVKLAAKEIKSKISSRRSKNTSPS